MEFLTFSMRFNASSLSRYVWVYVSVYYSFTVCHPFGFIFLHCNAHIYFCDRICEKHCFKIQSVLKMHLMPKWKRIDTNAKEKNSTEKADELSTACKRIRKRYKHINQRTFSFRMIFVFLETPLDGLTDFWMLAFSQICSHSNRIAIQFMKFLTLIKKSVVLVWSTNITYQVKKTSFTEKKSIYNVSSSPFHSVALNALCPIAIECVMFFRM